MRFFKQIYRYINGIYSVLVNGDLKLSKVARENVLVEIGLVTAVKAFDLLRGGEASKEIKQTMETYMPKEADRKCWLKVKRDIWKCRELYLVNPNEYFLFGFENLCPKERHQFVGNREKELLCRKMNVNDVWKIFYDKWETYQRFEKYYGREVICVRSKEDKQKFEDFCSRHKKIIVKANNSSQGKGIFIADVDTENKVNEIFKIIAENFNGKYSVVIEEWVRQSDKLGKFHPSSVNTVRIATFIRDDGIVLLFPRLRMGGNNSLVDNYSAGGVTALIDLDSGVIQGGGVSKSGKIHKCHPDTKEIIEGYKMPEWEKAIALVKELAMIVPEQRYVGWDLAYTDNGWIMIEGNSYGQFSSVQTMSQGGVRPIIEDTFYRYI